MNQDHLSAMQVVHILAHKPRIHSGGPKLT